MSTRQLQLPLLTRWRVALQLEQLGYMAERIECTVYATTSTDAVARARDEFYGKWATEADRRRMPLRALEVMQECV